MKGSACSRTLDPLFHEVAELEEAHPEAVAARVDALDESVVHERR